MPDTQRLDITVASLSRFQVFKCISRIGIKVALRHKHVARERYETTSKKEVLGDTSNRKLIRLVEVLTVSFLEKNSFDMHFWELNEFNHF